MRVRVVAASALAVFLLTAPAAVAAPPWSEPRAFGTPTSLVSDATIAFGPGGSGLLSSKTGVDTGKPRDHLATLTPDGTLVEHRPLSDSLVAPPLVFGRGRVALLRERVLSEEVPKRLRLSLSLGSTARPAGRRRPRRLATFTTYPSGGAPAMAVGPQGQMAIVWMTYRGDIETGRFRVRLAVGRPDGRFQTHTVASGATDQAGNYDPPAVAVAIGARGDVTVSYSAVGSSIRVRTLRRGRRFGRPQSLGPDTGRVDLAARASRTGRVVVAWGTQDGGEDITEPYVVRAAMRASGAARFGPAQVIDPGERNRGGAGPIRLAMTADGTAALTWANASGGVVYVTHPVRMVVAEGNGGFGPVAELDADGARPDVALRGDGAAIVTWTNRGDGGPAFAAVRAGAGQPFGPPELVSPSGRVDRSLAVAYDPRTGRPTAVWGSDRLELATRSG